MLLLLNGVLSLLVYRFTGRRAAALAVLLIPGYGALVLGAVALVLRWGPRPSGDLLSEFREHVAPQLQAKSGLSLAELPLVEHLKVQPLIDLLQTPDLNLRKAVLEDMARRRSPRLIACIQAALSDPHPEIYQFAVAKLGQIQEWHSRELAQGRLEYQRGHSLPAGLLLARAYQDYLASGLLEKALEGLYLGQLAEHYSELLSRFGGLRDVLLARAEIQLRLHRPEPARADYLQVLRLYPGEIAAELGLLKIAYLRRDWSEWRAQALRLRQMSLPAEAREQVEWILR